MTSLIRVSCLIFLLSTSGSLFARRDAPMPGAARVPANQLDGTRLVLPEWNCSIETPGTNWTWFAITAAVAPGSAQFVCYEPEQDIRFLLVISREHGKVSDKFMKGFMNGAKGAIAKQGMATSDEKYQPSNIPIAGNSCRISFSITSKDGSKMTLINYVGSDANTYTIQCYAPQDADSEELTRFVSSLRLLTKTKPAVAKDGTGPLLFAAGALLGIILFFVARSIRKSRAEAR